MSAEVSNRKIPVEEVAEIIGRFLKPDEVWMIASGGRRRRVGSGERTASAENQTLCSRHGRVRKDVLHVGQENHRPGDWCLTPEHNVPGEDALAIRGDGERVFLTSPSYMFSQFLEQES